MTNQEAAKMISNDMKLHYDDLSEQYRKALNIAIDALLKEQEAVEPITDDDGGYWCGSCHEDIVWHQKYCSNCGRSVKWE